MMSRTLGASSGGTTRGGHHCFESSAIRPISPPKASGGGGSRLPSIVVVAFGAPEAALASCAAAGSGPASSATAAAAMQIESLISNSSFASLSPSGAQRSITARRYIRRRRPAKETGVSGIPITSMKSETSSAEAGSSPSTIFTV